MSLNDFILRQKEKVNSNPLSHAVSLQFRGCTCVWEVKIKKNNYVHRQSELFLKFVHTFHCSAILHLFVKVVSNLMILRIPESVWVCLCMWELLCFQVVLFNDGSLNRFWCSVADVGHLSLNYYQSFIISCISMCHTFDSLSV